jgi:hypothetical protein
MYRTDSRISCEVRAIKGKQAADPVDIHGSNDACVMDPNAGYGVGDDKATPFGVDRRNVGEKRHNSFESRSFAVGLARSKAQSISVHRSRAYIPELDNVLWRYAYAIA